MKPGRRPNPERLSRWYSRKRPPMPGVYEIKDKGSDLPRFAYWDGQQFRARSMSVWGAYCNRTKLSLYYSPWLVCWRGLYYKPAHCPAPVAAYQSSRQFGSALDA